MTIDKIIHLLQVEKECVLRNAEHRCNRDCENCDLCQIDTDLLEMYDAVLNRMYYEKSICAMRNI